MRKVGIIKLHSLISSVSLILLFLMISCSGSVLPEERNPKTVPSVQQIPSRSVITPSGTAIKNEPSSDSTITPTASATAVSTPSPRSTFEQSDESIPSCTNENNPLPIEEIGGIEGAIFYISGKSDLYTLSGTPPHVKPVTNLIQNVDSFIFSPDAEWLVGFSSQPAYLPSSNDYAFSLISKNGHAETVLLNTDDIDQVVHDHLQAPTYYLNYWSFEWMNDHLLKVTLGYGENRPHLFAFRYVDIVSKNWLVKSLSLPEQDHPYDWSYISPDETRILYVNKQDELVLFNLVNQKEIWKVFADRYVSLYPTAQWSRDGQRVAFITKHGGRDIQILSAGGQFYANVKKISFSSSQEFIPGLAHFAWSPNNEYLAISGILNDNQAKAQQPFLYLYDVLEERYISRCAMGSADHDVNPQIPLFSSDGNFLTTRFIPNTTSIFWLYDLNTKTVYQSKEGDFGALGWVEDFSSIWK